MLKRIFLDLDDVLNKFTPTVCEKFCGEPVCYEMWPKVGFDLAKGVSILCGRSVTQDELWGALSEEFWASVPKANEADELIELAAEVVGKDSVFVLTAPARDPLCLAGKMRWAYTNLPTWIQRQVVITAAKHVCAGPGAVLVDDAAHNINAFTKHGGDAFIWCRPWNCGNDEYRGDVPRLRWFAEFLADKGNR